MSALSLIISIMQTVAGALLQHKGNPAKIAEWTGYLNLAGVLAARWTDGNSDLRVLDDQLKEGVADGNRGLTAEQRAAWRNRDDLATAVARDWLAEHPKP